MRLAGIPLDAAHFGACAYLVACPSVADDDGHGVDACAAQGVRACEGAVNIFAGYLLLRLDNLKYSSGLHHAKYTA